MLTAGNGEVKALWLPGAAGGPVGYYVLRGANADPVGYVVANGEGAQTATIMELPNGVPVALSVAGVNVSGESPPSPLSAFVTPAGPEMPGTSGGQQPNNGVVSAKHSALPAPTITGLRESAKRWRLGHHQATISARRPRLPVGTVFSFSLNGAATITATFTKQVSGSRRGGRCVARSQHAAGRRCTLTLIAGTLRIVGHAGLNHLGFQGRLSATTSLRAGSYGFSVYATNAGGARSAASSIPFVIAGVARARK